MQRHNIAMSNRPVYYVQSPPDSSPADTNRTHSHTRSWEGVMHHHARVSSGLSSVSFKPAELKKINDDSKAYSERFVDVDVHGERTWKQYGSSRPVEEETLLPTLTENEEVENKGIPCRVYVLGFIFVFLVLFFMFALILWGASHNQRPVVTMKSITFLRFDIQAGTDATEVPTDLGTLNSTVRLEYRNTGSFFGVHVSSTPINIDYSEIKMASGNIDYFYQSRKSRRNITVNVMGYQVPLYGGGSGLTSKSGAKLKPVNMTLSFNLRSRGNVLGKLVAPKFYNSIQCSVILDQNKLNTLIRLNDTLCKYN